VLVAGKNVAAGNRTRWEGVRRGGAAGGATIAPARRGAPIGGLMAQPAGVSGGIASESVERQTGRTSRPDALLDLLEGARRRGDFFDARQGRCPVAVGARSPRVAAAGRTSFLRRGSRAVGSVAAL